MHIKFRRGEDKGKRILDLSHLCWQIDCLHGTSSKSSLIKFLCATKIACALAKTLFSYCNISATVLLKLSAIFCEHVPVSLYKTKHVINVSKLLQAVLYISLGALRSDDGDGNGNATTTIGLISKTIILHVHHAFLYISLPSVHDYDVKMPNFTMYRGSTQATTKFPLSF